MQVTAAHLPPDQPHHHGVWSVTFGIHVAADAAAEYVAAIPIWLDVVVSIAAFVGAVVCSRCYPGAVRRRALTNAQRSARPEASTNL